MAWGKQPKGLPAISGPAQTKASDTIRFGGAPTVLEVLAILGNGIPLPLDNEVAAQGWKLKAPFLLDFPGKLHLLPLPLDEWMPDCFSGKSFQMGSGRQRKISDQVSQSPSHKQLEINAVSGSTMSQWRKS